MEVRNSIETGKYQKFPIDDRHSHALMSHPALLRAGKHVWLLGACLAVYALRKLYLFAFLPLSFSYSHLFFEV